VRDLLGLAQQRDFVERERGDFRAGLVDRFGDQRMQRRFLRARQALRQIVDVMMIHQKAYRAELHAVDRQSARDMAMQRAQHETVATERDDDVRLVERRIAVTRFQRRQRGLRFIGLCGNEGNAMRVHGSSQGDRREA